ncbi:MAG: Asp-tRNA(Asn)/Glu-tRNA(Gln) amidotransferase subunit GatC [Dongiaceae bacterium]
MAITEADVVRIAKLARIKIPAEKQSYMAQQVTGIMKWIDQIQEVDTSKVEPMTSVGDFPLPLREDKVTDGGYRDDILKNAPDAKHGFFTVPTVVE